MYSRIIGTSLSGLDLFFKIQSLFNFSHMVSVVDQGDGSSKPQDCCWTSSCCWQRTKSASVSNTRIPIASGLYAPPSSVYISARPLGFIPTLYAGLYSGVCIQAKMEEI